jgi:hypothetical protein
MVSENRVKLWLYCDVPCEVGVWKCPKRENLAKIDQFTLV